MVMFECPECHEEFEGGRSSVVSQVINHMRSEHDEDVTRDYVIDHMEEEEEEDEE